MSRAHTPWFDRLPVLAATVLLTALAACRAPTPDAATTSASTGPTQAVNALIADLRNNDLAGYARHALPPDAHTGVARAWSEGRSLWPLTVLPLHARLPAMIDDLSSPGAEQRWQATYQRQFAGEHAELKSAAVALGLFSVHYLQSQTDLGADERDHSIQLAKALSQWGASAPLGDPKHAHAAIARLAAAARGTGLVGQRAFARAGMDPALQRLGPFLAASKQVLAGYGLDVDAALAEIDARLLEQTGELARVRVRYRLAGQVIDATVAMERVAGHWYPAGPVQHARRLTREAAPVPPSTD